MSKYRQEQCELMLEAVNRAGRKGVTRLEFAKLLDIKKGQHLNKLIAELVSRDLVIVKRVKDQHNRKLFVYLPNELPNPPVGS